MRWHMRWRVHKFPCAVTLGLLGFFFIGAEPLFAMDSTEILPTGINSPQLRMGVVDSVDQTYASDGSLMSLSDVNSIEFDTDELVKIEPRVAELVAALNQFGRQNMGSELTLGVLRVNTEPEVRYLAPIHAYGVTDKWTLAFGVPIVYYKNKLSFSQEQSNIDVIRTQVGGVSRDIDDAFDQLNVSLVTEAKKELAAKGYRPLVDRDETIIGDVQLVSLYQVYKSGPVTGLWKTILNLPTGPGDDPDDLADIGLFGETAIEQYGIASARVWPSLTLAGKVGYRFHIPDEVIRRVPTSSEDTLPGAETKESVERKIGGIMTLGASANYKLFSRVTTGIGYEYSQKSKDSYSGHRGSNYSLLEEDTSSQAERIRFDVSYDTVSDYLAKKAMIPAIVSYEFSDVFRGINVGRQSVHEVWITLFF